MRLIYSHQHANRQGIIDGFKELIGKAGPNDNVIIYHVQDMVILMPYQEKSIRFLSMLKKVTMAITYPTAL